MTTGRRGGRASEKAGTRDMAMDAGKFAGYTDADIRRQNALQAKSKRTPAEEKELQKLLQAQHEYFSNYRFSEPVEPSSKEDPRFTYKGPH